MLEYITLRWKREKMWLWNKWLNFHAIGVNCSFSWSVIRYDILFLFRIDKLSHQYKILGFMSDLKKDLQLLCLIPNYTPLCIFHWFVSSFNYRWLIFIKTQLSIINKFNILKKKAIQVLSNAFFVKKISPPPVALCNAKIIYIADICTPFFF